MQQMRLNGWWCIQLESNATSRRSPRDKPAERFLAPKLSNLIKQHFGKMILQHYESISGCKKVKPSPALNRKGLPERGSQEDRVWSGDRSVQIEISCSDILNCESVCALSIGRFCSRFNFISFCFIQFRHLIWSSYLDAHPIAMIRVLRSHCVFSIALWGKNLMRYRGITPSLITRIAIHWIVSSQTMRIVWIDAIDAARVARICLLANRLGNICTQPARQPGRSRMKREPNRIWSITFRPERTIAFIPMNFHCNQFSGRSVRQCG